MGEHIQDRAEAQRAIEMLLGAVGEDLTRKGIVETPARAAKAWMDYTSGYNGKPKQILKAFEDGAEGCGDEVVLVANIPIYSTCEHHLAMIWGFAHVGYLPRERIVGLSKMARLADMFARRLQVQERLTNQIADAMHEHLKPRGVGVVLECRHACMESRGVQSRGTVTTTSALRGLMREDPSLRAEFLNLVSNSSHARNGI